MAIQSAAALSDIDAAFYEKEIDDEIMMNMKEDVRKLIDSFGEKCRCEKK